MPLDEDTIVIRSIEISKSFIDTSSGYHGYDLGITQDVGDAARLAMNLRNCDIIDDPEYIGALSVGLKVHYDRLCYTLLPILEDLDWISLKTDRRRVTRIEENIPNLDQFLTTLGKYWEEQSLTDVDIGSVSLLDHTTREPISIEALSNKLDIPDSALPRILDYGFQANYLNKIELPYDEEEAIISPLYWGHNSQLIEKFLKNTDEAYFESLKELSTHLRKFPGYPLEGIKSSYKNIINPSIKIGYLSVSQLKIPTRGEFQYTFGPSPHFNKDSKTIDVFEKAKIIVAAIRHGQFDALGSQIKYPTAILNSLRTRGLTPHTYTSKQYFLLMLHNICKFERSPTRYGPGHRIYFNSTPENELAADIAKLLLMGRETEAAIARESNIQNLLINGTFNYTSQQRKMKRARKVKAQDEFGRLVNSVLGTSLK